VRVDSVAELWGAIWLYDEMRTAIAGACDVEWPLPAAEVRETARRLTQAACAVWAVCGELVLPRERRTLLPRGILHHVLADDRDLLDESAKHVIVRDPWVLGLLAARGYRLARTYRDRRGPEPDWAGIELVWRVMGVIWAGGGKVTLFRNRTNDEPCGTLYEVMDGIRPSLPSFAELTPRALYEKLDDARRRHPGRRRRRRRRA
jgi:hypothetical protein